jgi:hypothetical protein
VWRSLYNGYIYVYIYTCRCVWRSPQAKYSVPINNFEGDWKENFRATINGQVLPSVLPLVVLVVAVEEEERAARIACSCMDCRRIRTVTQ